jgi:uncharacterized protein (UPF0335 family)
MAEDETGNGAEAPKRGRKAKSAEGKPNDDLARFVDRLEKLELNRRDIVEDIKEVLKEANDRGYLKRALRAVVKQRLETPEEETKRAEFEESLDAMLSRLGMIRDLPLGQAAEEAARSGR